MLRRYALSMLGTLVVGCSLLGPLPDTGSDALPSGGGSSTSSGASSSGGDPPGSRDGEVPPPDEGGTIDPDAGDDGSGVRDNDVPDVTPECTTGGLALPTRAINVTPAADGVACNIDNVLTENGAYAGLDRPLDQPNNLGRLAGREVTGCIAVEFSKPISAARIRMLGVPEACGHRCGDACGSGHDVDIFAGTSEDSLQFIQEFKSIGATLTTRDVTISNATARFVAVCRQSWGPKRDDIAVDSITGTCR